MADQEVDQLARGLAALPLDVATACDLGTGRAVAFFADDLLRDVSTCEERVLTGLATPPCPDAETGEDIVNDANEYATRVQGACGSPGGPPAGLFEVLVRDLVEPLYPSGMEETDSARRRCRQAIGGAVNDAAGLARRRLRAWRVCHTQVLCAQTSGPCPDAETLAVFATASSRLDSMVHLRCDAYTPGDLGFGSPCPSIGSCGSLPVTTISELIACIDCVATSTVDEIVALGF